MASRTPLVVANWKMYLDRRTTLRAANSLAAIAGNIPDGMDVVVCPSFPLLAEVQHSLEGTRVLLGAQDVSANDKGPFTGDVSVTQLRELVRYVIVGHSERRRNHGETDDIIAAKARHVVRAGMHPILCVGETVEERDRGETISVLKHQVSALLEGLPVLDLPKLVFTYEPVWAISTGPGEEAPQPGNREVAEAANLVRRIASDLGNQGYAEKMRVLYGGSVTPKTVGMFVAEPGIDGVLVGAASIKPADLVAIAKELSHAALR